MNKKILFVAIFAGFLGFMAFSKYNENKTAKVEAEQQAVKAPKCLAEYKAEITPENEGFMKLLEVHKKGSFKLPVTLKNISKEPFIAVGGKGGVNIAYAWLDKTGKKAVLEGSRTKLTENLGPFMSAKAVLNINFPEKGGEYKLVLSPVQEGCAWFYRKDEKSSYEIKYTVK